MRNTTRWLVGSGAVALLALSLAGCTTPSSETSSTRPAASELEEGLTVLDQSADWGMNAAFKRNGRVIYLETRVGTQKPEVYRNAFPDEPAEEMDALVTDEDGRVVYVQQGGDELVEPAWHEALVAESKRPIVDARRRAEDFQLISDAVEAFEASPVAKDLKHIAMTMNNARISAAHELELTRARVAAQGEIGYAPANNSFEIHGKWLIWGVAEHTASYSNIGGVLRNSCNHGTCASSMSRWCTTTSMSGSAQGYAEYGTSTGSVGTGNCRTSYNWNSTGGGHNCHDDTVRALWGFKYGAQSDGYSGVCNNSASHWYGPDSCNESSW